MIGATVAENFGVSMPEGTIGCVFIENEIMGKDRMQMNKVYEKLKTCLESVRENRFSAGGGSDPGFR